MIIPLVCLFAALVANVQSGYVLGGEPVYHYDAEYAPAYDNYKPKDYKFEYAVSDPHTGDHKSQWEVKENGVVRGAYSLLEPDGTTRIVEYVADDGGFRAVVKKIGEAIHDAPVNYQTLSPLYEQSSGAYSGQFQNYLQSSYAGLQSPVTVTAAPPAYHSFDDHVVNSVSNVAHAVSPAISVASVAPSVAHVTPIPDTIHSLSLQNGGISFTPLGQSGIQTHIKSNSYEPFLIDAGDYETASVAPVAYKQIAQPTPIPYVAKENYVQPIVAKQYVASDYVQQPVVSIAKTYAQPIVAKSYAQPILAKTYSEPILGQQAYAQQAYAQQAYSQQAYAQPTYAQQAYATPVVAKSYAQPLVAKAYATPYVKAYSQPIVAKSYVQQPNYVAVKNAGAYQPLYQQQSYQYAPYQNQDSYNSYYDNDAYAAYSTKSNLVSYKQAVPAYYAQQYDSSPVKVLKDYQQGPYGYQGYSGSSY